MSELADWELFVAGEDALTASVPVSTRALSGNCAPTCLTVWMWTVRNLGANTPDIFSALVLEVKKGVQFHPVKLIRHSRAIGFSFCASNSAADEVAHICVRSHLPGLYLPCVYLLIPPKPVQDLIQILPNSGWVFPFGPGPKSTDVQAHPREPQRIRRQSLSPRDRIVRWNCAPSAAGGCRAHVQHPRPVGGLGLQHTGYTSGDSCSRHTNGGWNWGYPAPKKQNETWQWPAWWDAIFSLLLAWRSNKFKWHFNLIAS